MATTSPLRTHNNQLRLGYALLSMLGVGCVVPLLTWVFMTRAAAGDLPVRAPSDIIKSAEATKKPESAAVLFVSTNKNLMELDKQVTDLYLTLFNTGRLSVRKIASQGLEIEAILRQNNLLFGDKMSPELDSLVCDLNDSRLLNSAPLCSRAKEAVSPAQLSVVTSHVSGYKPSRGNWSTPINATLLLPDAGLERTQRWVPYDKIPGTKIEDIVIKELGGCTTFDEICRGRITKFNARIPEAVLFASDFGGRISLPALGVRSKVDLSTASEQQTQPETADPSSGLALQPLEDSRNKCDSAGACYKLKQFPASQAQQTSIERGTNSDITTVIRALDKNLVGSYNASAFTNKLMTPSDFQVSRKSLLDLIKFPYGELKDYPGNMRSKVVVAVLDKWVDKDHCAFAPSNFDILNIETQDTTGVTKFACDHLDDTPNPNFDHGTHVAGLIGAKDDKHGPWGLNPFARILVRQVNLNLENPENVEKLKTAIDELAANDAPVVVNVSWGYFKDIKVTDHLGESFETASSVLFVVAAGNEGERLSYICDVRPACFDLPNVISVAALDSKTPPGLLLDGDKTATNYGTRIHTGAIGDHVLSTISYGRYGPLSGTSQAAPQVTAVASLLLGARRFDPIEVKNRVIACSDFVDKLASQLLGGRLNARCVLEYQTARLQRKGDDPDKPPRGSLRATGNISFKHRVTGKTYMFKATEIRALHAADGDRFIVFYNFDRDDPKSTLLRQDELVLDPPGQTVIFDRTDAVPNPLSVLVSVQDITKYVSSIN